MDSMDSLALVIVLVVLVWASFHVIMMSGRRKLPPGPYAFPIVGNILQLGSNTHQSLTNLSKIYGPLMSLQLGSLYTVVVSSPEVAKQVFRYQDHALSSRTIISAAEVHDFHNNSLGLIPVGDRWRNIRKICREHLFSTRRLDESQGLRLQKLTKLRDYIHDCSETARVVNVGEAVFITVINLITFTFFSVDTFDSYQDNVAHDLREAVEGWMKSMGAPNLADFFPLLKPFDPQGIKRQSKFYMGKLLEKFEDIINPRLKSRGSKHDLLETLVNLMEDAKYNLSINDFKYLFLVRHSLASLIDND